MYIKRQIQKLKSIILNISIPTEKLLQSTRRYRIFNLLETEIRNYFHFTFFEFCSFPKILLSKFSSTLFLQKILISLYSIYAIQTDVYEESEADLISERNNNDTLYRSTKSWSPDFQYSNGTKTDRKFSSGYFVLAFYVYFFFVVIFVCSTAYVCFFF